MYFMHWRGAGRPDHSACSHRSASLWYRPLHRVMAHYLKARDIVLIIGQIVGWEGKLSWAGLCDAVELVIGRHPTRQTLNAHEKIKALIHSSEGWIEIRPCFGQAICGLKHCGAAHTAGRGRKKPASTGKWSVA